MGLSKLDRRAVLAGLGGMALTPQIARAKEYIDLSWRDLMPDGAPSAVAEIEGLFHDRSGSMMSAQQPKMTGVRNDWNGKRVRLPGYIVPLDFSGMGVTIFLLAPFVGACIHVPPPPANQLVFVTTEKPYMSRGIFDAVNVIGMFGTAPTTTELADVAYALSADLIEPYRR